MTPTTKAVFFDLDDTLCAYWAASRLGLRLTFDEHELPGGTDAAIRAWRSVFSSFSPEIKTDRWYQRYLESGEATRTEHMRRMLETLGAPNDAVAAKLSARYAELRDINLEAFPETYACLDFLEPRYVMGLITNGPADVQRQEIATLDIEKYFDHILIEGELRIGKPHQQVFDEAAKRCAIEPESMLFVGNAFEHDVQGAKNAGWKAIWLNRAAEPNPGGEPQPDATVDNLWGVVDWLGLHRPPFASDPAVNAESVRNWRS